MAKPIAGFLFSNAKSINQRKKETHSMNRDARRVPTNFGPDTRFEVRPVPPAPFPAVEENGLELLKNRLLRDALYELGDARFNGYVRRAANEAAALAWVTPFPLLVFPTLFAEKTETALNQAERQISVRRRSLELLTV